MISLAKRQLGSNRSKEDQLIDCGLMLRQFNEKNRSNDDTWNSDVLESKLEELWGPEVAHSVQDIFGKQEFVQSLKTKDFQEAKLLKHKYLDWYAQMISIAKKQLRSNRSKEDQLIDLGLMLR